MSSVRPIIQLNSLLGLRIEYLGNGLSVLSLEALKKTFETAATKLQIAKERFREFFKFRFSIGLHIDDIVVLEYIKSNL